MRTNSKQYHVNTYEFINSDDGWEAGEEPKMRIYIDADEGILFSKEFKEE